MTKAAQTKTAVTIINGLNSRLNMNSVWVCFISGGVVTNKYEK